MKMTDIKWIKVMTDMFDNRKIKQIETLPEADTLLVIWLKLLCLAGTINDNGLLYLTKEIPYTDEMMAKEFNRPINTVRLALQTFVKFQMIEIIDDIVMISNWEKYQQIDGMEKVREQNRIRKQKQRERQKMALLECKDSVSRDMSRDVTQQNKIKNKNYSLSKDKENNIVRHRYGEFKHVLLADNDLTKLRETFGNEKVDYEIQQLDEYIENTGKSYKNHYLTIRNWIKKDLEKNKSSGTVSKKNSFNNFEQRNDTDFDALEKKLTGGAG